jgi:hypothetical protein
MKPGFVTDSCSEPFFYSGVADMFSEKSDHFYVYEFMFMRQVLRAGTRITRLP